MDRENTWDTKIRSAEQPLELVDDVIEEILSRLSVKSLLRLRCVSKSWRSLIGSERFIKTQLKNSRKSKTYAHWRVILNCNSRNPVPGLKQCCIRSFFDGPSVDPSPIDDPTNNHLMTGRVVGHCNGLLCILKQPGCLFLWNPTTRISIELPKLDLEIKKYGFGWDEQSGAYKVFAVVPKHNDKEEECIGNVYSSKTNSWKTVEHGSLDLYDRGGAFACGKIHWLTEGGRYIEYLDLKGEVFGMIEQPCKQKVGQRLRLSEISGCLSLICDNKKQSDIWVMKQERWVKVRTDKRVVKFLPREKIVGCDQTCLYIESLVSPVPDKND